MAISGVGPTGRNHPNTSRVAGSSPLKTTQQDQLRDLVINAGAYGLTCHEAFPSMGGIAKNQIATRMMELRKEKSVYRLALTRPTTPGNSAHVHVSAAVWQAMQTTTPLDSRRNSDKKRPFIPHGTPQGLTEPVRRRYVQG